MRKSPVTPSARDAVQRGIMSDDFETTRAIPRPRAPAGGIGELEPLGAPSGSGELLAHYELLAPVGQGAMGRVYRARDTLLDREVAVKILSDECQADAGLQERFIREAKMIARLSHPNLPQIHFIGRAQGRLFFAMEWIEGETLEALARRGPIPVEQALDVARQAAGGLSAAHRAGVLHRDIKPSNIMLTRDGIVKLLDFGIARSLAFDTGATMTGQFIGTAHYASPEQASGQKLDARSDLYSLGATLYQLLSGRPPFEGDSALAVLTARLTSPAPELPADLECEPPLRRLVRAMMAKDPDERPGDADEIVRRIDEVHPGHTVPARGSRRLPAALFDLLLLAIPLALLHAVFLRVNGYFLTTLLYDSFAGRVALGAGLLACALGYVVLLTDRQGRTPGQRLQGIQIASRDGKRPSRRQLVTIGLITWVPVCLLLALQSDWPPRFDPERGRFEPMVLEGGLRAVALPWLALLARSNGPLLAAALWALGLAAMPRFHRRGWNLADRLSRTEVVERVRRSVARAGDSASGASFATAARSRGSRGPALANAAVLAAGLAMGVFALLKFLPPRAAAMPYFAETVAHGEPGWERLFVGFRHWALRREERIVNPEALEFRRTLFSPLFWADTRAPVTVENDACGVSVEHESKGWWMMGYWEHSYSIRELAPRDSQEARRWDTNRRAAYRGSAIHFMRALTHRRLAREGFRVLNPEAFVGLLRRGDEFVLVAWPRLEVEVAGASRVRRITLKRGWLDVSEDGSFGGAYALHGWTFLDQVPFSVLDRYAKEQDAAWGEPTSGIREVLRLE